MKTFSLMWSEKLDEAGIDWDNWFSIVGTVQALRKPAVKA